MKRQPIHANKKYIALFYDKCEMLLDKFSDEEAGKILKAVMNYELYGIEPAETDRTLDIFITAMCHECDLTIKKFSDKSAKAKAAINKRWEDKREMTQEEIDAEIDRMFPRTVKRT